MPQDEILDGSTWTDVQPKEEILDGSTWVEPVKKKVTTPDLNSGGKTTSQSVSTSTSTSQNNVWQKTTPSKVGNTIGAFNQTKQIPVIAPTNKNVLGEGTVVAPTKEAVKPIDNPYDTSAQYITQADNTDTGLVNVSQQAESKRVAQEAEKVKREQELANPNSFQNIGTSYKEKALKTTGNNDIEKMLNFGDINGNKAFVEATLDDNDKHVLGVIKEIEKINNDNKIYEQQLKSGAITQEIYDAHKKENTKKSIDLNAEYVKGIQSRNSAIDDEIKQSQTKLANGYDIKMLGAQPYYEPLTTQQIDEEKKKIKTLTDLKNDVLIDVNNPVKSLEKHEGFQNAEKEGLIPNGATNTQKVRIYSYILADKAKKLATELGYNPNDVKSLMGDKFGSNTPKMFWEQLKSLVVGSNPKEKEYVHTMAELQAIAPIAILNKNNLTLNEGYTSNLVSSFRKSVAPLFVRNQIATDEDRNALTKEAFNQAGVNQDVNSAYTTQQGNVDKESKTIGKTVSRTAGDIFGIGVKVAGINTLLGIPGQAIEMAVGKPVIQGLDKALSTSKEAQALEYTKLAETTTKTASEAKKVEDAKKVLDVAKVVTEKLPNNFLTRTIYGTLKSGVVHEIQGRVNDELKGFANFGVGSVNHLIGMPINTLGQVAIKMFGKEAPLFVEKVIQAAQSGTAMTATMAGMTVVNAARETEDMSAFKDVLDQHFGTKEKALRFVAENFLLGLALHAVNANTVSGLFKSKYDEGYSKLSPEEKAKVDDFVKDTNEKANDFETATKDAVEQVQKDDHKPLTTDKEIEDGINEFKDAEKIPSLSVGDNKDGNSTGMAGSEQDAKIESAVIEIGGKIYEGKNHAEAILKAKADGQDISQVNRQAEGKFKLSDGTIIDRAEAKTRFGQDRSELIIPQDEAAKQANKDYAEITKGLKNEQTNQNTPEQQDNGNSTGMAGSEQNSKAVRAESEQGKLSNEDKIQQNATTEVQKQITEVEKIISELEDNPNSPFHKLVNLDEQKQKLSELQKKEAEVKKESAQPVLPETKAQKAANPRLSETPKEEVEGVSGSALKDVVKSDELVVKKYADKEIKRQLDEQGFETKNKTAKELRDLYIKEIGTDEYKEPPRNNYKLKVVSKKQVGGTDIRLGANSSDRSIRNNTEKYGEPIFDEKTNEYVWKTNTHTLWEMEDTETGKKYSVFGNKEYPFSDIEQGQPPNYGYIEKPKFNNGDIFEVSANPEINEKYGNTTLKNIRKQSIKAPTQYTEAATPTKKESGGVSGSALKDVEDKKAGIERRKQELESSREIETLYDLRNPIAEDSKEIISKIEEANKLRKNAQEKSEQAVKETDEEKIIALNSDANNLNEKARILDKEVKKSRDSVINDTQIKQAINSAKILGQRLLNKIKLAAKSNEWISSMPISEEEFAKLEDAIKRLSVKDMGEVTSNSEVIPDILLIEEINAKYDAELATSEETSGVSGSALKDVESKIKSIIPETKIVNKNNEPIKVYHGTRGDGKFMDFEKGDIGFHFGRKETAQQRGDNVLEVYLNIKHPIDIKDKGAFEGQELVDSLYEAKVLTKAEYDYFTKEMSELPVEEIYGYNTDINKQLRDKIKEKGYDGFTYTNMYEGAAGKSFIALDKNQIIFADGRNLKSIETSKAPTQYTEAATPKEEVEVVSGSALKDVDLGGGIKNKATDEGVNLLPISEIDNLRSQKQTDLATGNAVEMEKDLSKNGIKEPLVITYYPNEGKAVLTDGHNRLDVAKDMGAEKLPIRIVERYTDAPNNAKDWTPPQAPTQYTEAAGGSALKDVESKIQEASLIKDDVERKKELDKIYNSDEYKNWIKDAEEELKNNKTQVAEGKGSWRKAFNETSDAMRKKDILRAVADVSTDINELNEISKASKGLPEGLQSEIDYAVEHKKKSLAPTQYTEAATPKDDSAIQSGGEQKLPDQKVLFNDAIQYYKDKGLSYEEVKSRLDKNDVDYEEADLKDAWDGGKDVPPVDENKKQQSNNPKEVKKTVLTKRIYENPNEVAEFKHEIQTNYDLKRKTIPHEEALFIANDIVKKYGIDNALDAVRKKDIQGGVAQEIFYAKYKDLDAKINSTKDEGERLQLIGEKAKIASEWSDFNTTAGQQSSQMADIYKRDDGVLFNVEIQKQKYREANDGVLPKEIEEKFDALNKTIEDANKRISEIEKEKQEIEDKYKESVDKKQVDEYIKEAYEKGKKDGSAGKAIKTSKVKLEKAKAEIAEGLQDFLQAVGGLNMAAGNVMPSITKALKKIGNGLIKAGEATAENVFDKIVEYIEKNTGKKPDIEDYRSEFDTKKDDGKIKVSSSRVKEIVEARRLDGKDTTVKDLLDELKKDFPDGTTDRVIRDAFTGYGKTSELPQGDDATVRKLRRMSRYESILEDLDNGIRPSKTGKERDTLESDERAKLKEIREGLKKLKPSDEDLSKKLKTSQDAIETRLKNRIEDLKRQIDAGKKDTRIIKPISTPDIEKLRKEVKKLEDDLDEVVSKNRHSDTLQELKDNAEVSGNTTISKADVKNGLISDLVQAHIEKGTPISEVQQTIFDELKEIFPDTTEAQVRDAILKQGDFKSKPKETTALQIRLSELKTQLNLQKSIEETQAGIIKATKEKGAQSDEVIALKKKLADAKKEALNKYPEVSAKELEKKIERTQKSIDEYKRKTAEKEFVKTQATKREFHNNADWVKKNKELYLLQLEKAKAKAEFEREQDKLKDKEKSNTEKVGEFLGKVKRFDIFTSFFGMGRLALAAVARPLTLPLRESAKYLLSRNLPDIIRNKTGLSLPTATLMEKSAGNYRKDFAQSLRYMADYYASYFGKKIYKDAISEFNKRSNYSLEKDAKGKDRYSSFIGRILSAPEQAHGFMKAFAKLPQYNATFNVTLENMNRMIDKRTGEIYDITDPYVQSLAIKEAKREADADVFMEDSDLARANSALWSGLSKSDNYIVQLAGIYGKQLEPVIKVPVNFFSETLQGFPLVGFADAIQTIARSGDVKNKKSGGYRGMSNLTPEQAHLASRKLTNQIVGFMGIAIGMGLYKLYKDDAIKELEHIEHWAHNTSFPLIMMGLDLAKELEKEDSTIGDIAKIPYKEAKKLTTALPQYRSMRDYVFTTEKSIGKRAKGLLIPTVLKELGIVKDDKEPKSTGFQKIGGGLSGSKFKKKFQKP